MIDFKKQINECFENYLNDLELLVRHNSIYDESTSKEGQPFGQANKEVLEEMLQIGQRDGFETANIDGYAGHIDIGDGDEIIGVLGHLDVVPVNETGWDTDPFTLTIKDNKLYGRGTSDDKGPILAAYYAAKLLVDNGYKLNKKIRIIFGCNEESGSRCMRYYFTKVPYPAMGFTPDANFPVVYGEKKGAHFSITGKLDNSELISFKSGTVANIVPERAVAIVKKDLSELQESYVAYLDRYELDGTIEACKEGTRIELVGKSSHASLPHLGKNAATYLCGYLNTVIEHPLTQFVDKYFFEDYSAMKLGFGFTGMMGPLTLNVGILNYENQEVNMILDLRCPHEVDEEKMVACIDEAIEPYGLEEKHFIGKHLFVDPESDFIKALHYAYVDCTGDVNAKPQAIGGGTYAKMMPNCVAFGPEFEGTDNQIHQNNEFAKIDEVKLEIEIYANALYNLAK